MYFCDPVDSGTFFEDIVFVYVLYMVVVVDPYIQIYKQEDCGANVLNGDTSRNGQ